ncbi:uncharacterized protein [Littorina saxatilis]|uniref:C-type lectin domain-containing protein n=1 Tax=Littorina saxatilis TaxID=31220 RepID=A0AAN9AZZ2_9CAEN
MTSFVTKTYYIDTALNMPVLFLLMVTSLCAQKSQSERPAASWGSDPSFVSLQPSPSAADLKMESTSLMDCAALCSTNTWCSSFFYNSKRSQCLLFRGFYVDTEGLQQNPGAEYYLMVSDRCPSPSCFHLSRQDNVCFLYLRENKTYQESNDLCQGYNGSLAILDTLSKNDWVVGLLRLNNVIAGGVRLFLGAQRNLPQRNGKVFQWSNGQKVAANGSSESFWPPPGPKRRGEFCLVLYAVPPSPVKWYDSSCDHVSSGVLCEYDEN